MSASFLDQLARARPDPGGGAAAAYSAGVGLALLTKVIRLEKTRPCIEESLLRFWTEKLAETRRLTRIFLRLRQADVEAYLTMAQALSPTSSGRWKRPPAVPGRSWRKRCWPWTWWARRERAAGITSSPISWWPPSFWAGHSLPLINTTIRQKEWSNRLSQASHQGLEATLRVRSQLLAKAHAANHA